jgi:hypothetical protein
VGVKAGEANEYTTAGETGGAATGGEYGEGYLMGYVYGYRDGGGETINAVSSTVEESTWQPLAGVNSREAGVVSKQLPERCQWRRPELTEGGDYANKKDIYTPWVSARVMS